MKDNIVDGVSNGCLLVYLNYIENHPKGTVKKLKKLLFKNKKEKK